MARLAQADEELSFAAGADVNRRIATLLAAKTQLAQARTSQPSIMVRAPAAGVVKRTLRSVGEEARSNQVLVEPAGP